jgi:hypothetical protein
MPNFINKLKDRVIEVAKNKFETEETRTIRLNLCNECEHLIKITRQCSKCFCIVDGKVSLKNSKCPVGKW